MKRMRKLIMLTAIMFLAPAVSQAKTLEELLVEKGVITKGEATKAAASAPGSVSYANGVRWDFSDKNVSGSLSTMIRTRWTFTDYDKDDAVNRRNTSSFDVTQARLTADGTVLDKEFAYHMMGDFAGDSASLKDAYISYKACDWADLSMGQHRTGISRQFNTDENNWTFPDESAVSNYFNLGRQAGAWASLTSADMPLTFSAGIYNGESSGEGINRSGSDTLHTGVFAARYNVAGKINSMVESDLDNSEELGASVGAAVAFGQAKRTGVSENDDLFTLNIDAIAKYQGWSFGGEYYYKDIQNDAPDTNAKPSGFYAQVGYFLMPSEFELAARYGLISCDHGAAGGICAGTKNYNEVDLSANYYFWGNNLKAQLAWERLGQKPEASSGNTIATDKIILAVGGVF